MTDFPRIKYLKWDYEELTETQLQVSIYGFLLYIKEGTASSNKYVATQSQKHVILMFLQEMKVWIRKALICYIGESDGLSQPPTKTRKHWHKLVPRWRYCLLLNLVWVEWWGRRRNMECNSYNWQSFRCLVVKAQESLWWWIKLKEKSLIETQVAVCQSSIFFDDYGLTKSY